MVASRIVEGEPANKSLENAGGSARLEQRLPAAMAGVRLRKRLSPVLYTRELLRCAAPGSLVSARVIVPIVIDVVRPRSVVDLGSGTGSWLSIFAEHGVVDSVGIDADYVDRAALLIPRA